MLGILSVRSETTNIFSRVKAHSMSTITDMTYWQQWAEPLGLKLTGFSETSCARFTDEQSGQDITVSKFRGDRCSPNFRIFDRLRTEILSLREQVGPSSRVPSGPSAQRSPGFQEGDRVRIKYDFLGPTQREKCGREDPTGRQGVIIEIQTVTPYTKFPLDEPIYVVQSEDETKWFTHAREIEKV